MKRSNSEWDDWKAWKRGWPYKGDAPNDPQYVKDRNDFFKSNAPEDAPYNGWWINQGQTVRVLNMNKSKEAE